MNSLQEQKHFAKINFVLYMMGMIRLPTTSYVSSFPTLIDRSIEMKVLVSLVFLPHLQHFVMLLIFPSKAWKKWNGVQVP